MAPTNLPHEIALPQREQSKVFALLSLGQWYYHMLVQVQLSKQTS